MRSSLDMVARLVGMGGNAGLLREADVALVLLLVDDEAGFLKATKLIDKEEKTRDKRMKWYESFSAYNAEVWERRYSANGNYWIRRK